VKGRDRLSLALVVEPGDPRLVDLLAVHEPGRLLEAVRSRRPLPDVRVPESWAERAADLDRLVDDAVAQAAAQRLRWTCPGERDWPSAVHDLDHVAPIHGTTGAPLGLWVRGEAGLADVCEQSVAVVGARDCTTYGAECATDVAADCADAGLTVVSGAAYGIDGCAHRGALALGRPTVAVLAGGADVDYPQAHAALLGRITEHGGLVVSEQAPGQRPTKGRFLSRNRLIAALSGGTVVIEAALRSGSLNTLHWADQLGRPTMGLPGPVTSRQSAGVHAAVRGGEAVLVTGGADVVEELGGLGASPLGDGTREVRGFDLLPPSAQRALDALSFQRARSARDVAADARLSTREALQALRALQERGNAAQVDGRWLLARRADVG
jgi:DNA processing protein